MWPSRGDVLSDALVEAAFAEDWACRLHGLVDQALDHGIRVTCGCGEERMVGHMRHMSLLRPSANGGKNRCPSRH